MELDERKQLTTLQNLIYGLLYGNEIYNAIYSLSKTEKISLSEELTNKLKWNELFLKNILLIKKNGKKISITIYFL